MSEIKSLQLVKIIGFDWRDSASRSGMQNRYIGQTGRFQEDVKSRYDGAYSGHFVFEPDPLDLNPLNPCFHAVIVEPVEETHEPEKTN